MKCEGASPAAPEVRIEEKTNIRGVRGDAPRFPQAAARDSPDSVANLEKYRPLPALPPSASPEELAAHQMREAYRQCVFKLRWSKPQRDAYVAQHFGGKRFYQLTPDEVAMLVYRLRVLLIDEVPE